MQKVINMQKRRATTELTREGEVIPQYEEETVGEDSTPQEISQRKIFRARRPQKAAQAASTEPTSFKLKTQLVSEDLESKLLEAKPAQFSFLDLPDVEVREASPVKAPPPPPPKPVEPILKTPTISAFSGILKDLKEKKEDDIVSSFIKTASSQEAAPPSESPKFQDPIKPTQTSHFVLVEGKLSVNGASRGEGFIEIARADVGEKKVNLLIFRNSFKSIIYQAALAESSSWKECEKQEESDDEEEKEEASIEIVVYRKTDKLRAETCKVRCGKLSKIKLMEELEKVKKETKKNTDKEEIKTKDKKLEEKAK
ncbi:unnamed protein product [Blepharisma stoltei]|uniref:Uncharacterized protein n=1 Tax=Blepharisma stoltei TaxID=1481888 RepID=A0AAU9JS51_9CILI|nr:unnamed protein product [Blepharisma stoltei]